MKAYHKYITMGSIRLFGVASQFLLIYMASRAANYDDFGKFTIVLSASFLVGVIMTAGQVGAAYKALPAIAKSGNHAKLQTEVTEIFGALFASATLISIPTIYILTTYFGSFKTALIAFFCAVLMSALEVFGAILRSKGSLFYSEFFKNILWRLVFILTLFAFAIILEFEVTLELVLLSAIFINAIIALVSSRFTAGMALKIASPKVALSKLNTDVGRWTIVVSNAAFANLDVIIIGALLGPVQAASYFVAIRLANVVGLVLSITNPIIVPSISRLEKDRSLTKELAPKIKRNTGINILLSSATAFAIWLTSDLLFEVLANRELSISWTLNILLLSQIVNSTFGPTLLTSQIFDIQKPTIYLTLFSLAMFAAFTVLTLPVYGVVAMAWAVLVVRIIQNAGIAILLRQHCGFSIFTGNFRTKETR